MKRKPLVWCFALVVLAAVAILLLSQPRQPVSAPLALPDGSSVRVVAVTYGTNHVVGPPLARLVAHLPLAAQLWLNSRLGQKAQALHTTTTPTPTLVVWVERKKPGTMPPGGYFAALLSDQSGFISGENAYYYYGGWSTTEPLRFQVFPRREATFALEFIYHDPSGKAQRCGSLPIANPKRGRFPQWQPQSLPATQRAGDVEVTLEQLSTGNGNNVSYTTLSGGRHAVELNTNRADGRNVTACLMRLRPLAQTNQLWRVANVEVSDATGNRAISMSTTWGGPCGELFSFEPGLWLSEAAWKLRYEIKRTQGFAPGETFTFQGVPLGGAPSTNLLNWTTNFGGLTVTLTQFLHQRARTNITSWSSYDLSACKLQVYGLTNGVHLDLLDARTDTGTNLTLGPWSSGSTERTYHFLDIPPAARTADFTFAVQHARWVEFTVKPQVGATQLVSKLEGKSK